MRHVISSRFFSFVTCRLNLNHSFLQPHRDYSLVSSPALHCINSNHSTRYHVQLIVKHDMISSNFVSFPFYHQCNSLQTHRYMLQELSSSFLQKQKGNYSTRPKKESFRPLVSVSPCPRAVVVHGFFVSIPRIGRVVLNERSASTPVQSARPSLLPIMQLLSPLRWALFAQKIKSKLTILNKNN